ncbi:hypothetical protein [Phenylobacterium sp.]|uniref:hypothetical protein n=1 Tax=Phenylobacterium sp. TaxID=1871053 RepID=UPI0011FDD1D4|nr:hypothetical protein [Phenylobacterium sp.]THD58918.1 MAG: hypothetical protein E8A49_18190 [Phenylobacterium sp.]
MLGLETKISARAALRAVLAVGLVGMLGANLPGHLSYDSVAQLYEGHFHIRETWGPALYAWVLGFFDGFIPGTSLYVMVSAALLFGSLAAMADLRPRVSWLAPFAAAAAVLTPQLAVYQGIVWKDVMFANCAVAGFVMIGHAGRLWDDRARRWALLTAALVLMAAGDQVRQNGLIAGAFAALALGAIAARGRWRRGIVWGLGALVALVVVGQAETLLSEPPKAPNDNAIGTGVRIVQSYDLVGAVALDPTYRTDILAAANPAATAIVRKRAKPDYSGRRVDFMDRDTVMQDGLDKLSDAAFSKQWFDLILKHPALYLRIRWEDFRWVFAPPVVDWCLPIYVGVDAPAEKMAPLGLQHRYVQSDVMLANYASWFLDTPVMSHAFYAAVSLVLAGLLLWRRGMGDIAMAALQLAGAAFASSFFIISIACDYRYLYFTDLAAIAGLVYAAVDPPWPRRKAPAAG